MIRHHAFIEALAALDEKDPLWMSTLGGFSVLRVVDSIAGREAEPPLAAARKATEAIPQKDPSRGILMRIVDRLEKKPELSSEVGNDLLSYGRAMDVEARWFIAADIFDTLGEVFQAREHFELVTDAATALGSAARNLGDWERSASAYATAQHLADSVRDVARSLIVEVGIATTSMMRGNLPAADAVLDEVMAAAEREGLDSVKAIALHARASVAHTRGDYRRAIHFAHQSLELTTNTGARDRLLADIAAAYAGLGIFDTARDGYTIVALTSPHRAVRWQAKLNLMELAIAEGSEARFDELRDELDREPLDPRLRAYFLLYSGLGLKRFGRTGADEMLEAAREHAAQHDLHQIAFEAEGASRESVAATVAQPEHEVPTELIDIAQRISGLRQSVTG